MRICVFLSTVEIVEFTLVTFRQITHRRIEETWSLLFICHASRSVMISFDLASRTLSFF